MNKPDGRPAYTETISEFLLSELALQFRYESNVVIGQFLANRLTQAGPIGVAMVVATSEVLQIDQAIVVFVTVFVVDVAPTCIAQECKCD